MTRKKDGDHPARGAVHVQETPPPSLGVKGRAHKGSQPHAVLFSVPESSPLFPRSKYWLKYPRVIFCDNAFEGTPDVG